MSQKAEDGDRDVHQTHPQAAGHQRPGRFSQTHLRQTLQLDRRPRQQSASLHRQAALLHRRAGHLRVRRAEECPHCINDTILIYINR